MRILESYYKKTIRYDLINKFNYIKNVNEIPQLKKIILNFGCKSVEVRNIASTFLALELITTCQVSLVKAKRSNILLKVRKGNPVGCVVVLRKKQMYSFAFKLVSEVFPNLKGFKGISLSKKLIQPNFSFTIKDLINFTELEKQFYLFIDLPPMNVVFVTNTNTKQELKYLLQSFKIPIISNF